MPLKNNNYRMKKQLFIIGMAILALSCKEKAP